MFELLYHCDEHGCSGTGKQHWDGLREIGFAKSNGIKIRYIEGKSKMARGYNKVILIENMVRDAEMRGRKAKGRIIYDCGKSLIGRIRAGQNRKQRTTLSVWRLAVQRR